MCSFASSRWKHERDDEYARVCIQFNQSHTIPPPKREKDLLAYLLREMTTTAVLITNTHSLARTHLFFVDNDFQDILVIYYQIFAFDRLMAKGKMVFISRILLPPAPLARSFARFLLL
jgi:hypothetical protein